MKPFYTSITTKKCRGCTTCTVDYETPYNKEQSTTLLVSILTSTYIYIYIYRRTVYIRDSNKELKLSHLYGGCRERRRRRRGEGGGKGGVAVGDVLAAASFTHTERRGKRDTKSASALASELVCCPARGSRDVSTVEAFRLWSAPARGDVRTTHRLAREKTLSIYPQPAPHYTHRSALLYRHISFSVTLSYRNTIGPRRGQRLNTRSRRRTRQPYGRPWSTRASACRKAEG